MSKDVGIKIIRVTNPRIVDLMVNVPVPTLEMPKEEFLSTLADRLAMDDPDLYVCAAVNVKEDDLQLVAYIIAMFKPHTDYVFIYCAWTDNKYINGDDSRAMLQSVAGWTLSIGRQNIRFETTRVPKAFTRKYGFEVYSQVMGINLGTENGRRIFNRTTTVSSSGTASLNEAGGEHSSAGSEERASEVRGRESSGPDSGNADLQESSAGDQSERVFDGGTTSPEPSSERSDDKQAES